MESVSCRITVAAIRVEPDEAAIVEAAPRYGTLVSYGDEGGDRATHIAFWLGDGRIPHASAVAERVLEEQET